MEGAAVPPRLALEAAVADAIISGPLFELPIDLGAGRVEGTAKLTSAGHSMAAILATLAGEAGVVVRDGVLIGFDLAALQAAGGITELRLAERRWPGPRRRRDRLRAAGRQCGAGRGAGHAGGDAAGNRGRRRGGGERGDRPRPRGAGFAGGGEADAGGGGGGAAADRAGGGAAAAARIGRFLQWRAERWRYTGISAYHFPFPGGPRFGVVWWTGSRLGFGASPSSSRCWSPSRISGVA